jgi:hypothetical protein
VSERKNGGDKAMTEEELEEQRRQQQEAQRAAARYAAIHREVQKVLDRYPERRR